MTDNQLLIDLIAAKFRSGNSVQVERVTVTRAEFDAALAAHHTAADDTPSKSRMARVAIEKAAQGDSIAIGDYVLATKYADGDPGDHWGVGFYDGERNGRHYVKDGSGNQIRGNGFRRVGRIQKDAGRLLLIAASEWEKKALSGENLNLWNLVKTHPPQQQARVTVTEEMVRVAVAASDDAFRQAAGERLVRDVKADCIRAALEAVADQLAGGAK